MDKKEEEEIRKSKGMTEKERAAGSMNISEYIGYLWLMSVKGYKNKEIFFYHTETPDFLCTDGEKYEVKRLYGRSILIYDKQISNLDGSTIIVVDTEKREVIKIFEWDKREVIVFPEIKITRTGLHIYIKEGIEQKMVLLGLSPREVIDFIHVAITEKLDREEELKTK